MCYRTNNRSNSLPSSATPCFPSLGSARQRIVFWPEDEIDMVLRDTAFYLYALQVIDS